MQVEGQSDAQDVVRVTERIVVNLTILALLLWGWLPDSRDWLWLVCCIPPPSHAASSYRSRFALYVYIAPVS